MAIVIMLALKTTESKFTGVCSSENSQVVNVIQEGIITIWEH